MIYTWLFFFALPLNFIGFVIKYKTEINNNLVATFLTLISILGTCWFFKTFIDPTPFYYLTRGIGYGYLISAVATNGWDQFYGLKKVFKDIRSLNKFIYSLTQEAILMNEERLASYRRKLLKGLSTIGIYVGIVILICLYLQKGLTEIIDYTVTMTIGCMGTIILSDILNKAYFEKEKLNTQYSIVFFLSAFSLLSFTIGYFATDWTIFIVSVVVFLIVLSLTFFLAHYSYIPSLRSKKEIEDTEMIRKWLLYQTMTRDEIIDDMLKNILYYFKTPKWRSELDLTKPMFLDSKGTPQTAKAAADSNNSNAPIITATAYFESVIDTKETYKELREVR